jgi:superfamily II DNA or RNA helicase
MVKPICKIIIKDQVNIKLDGLDPSTRRKCVDALKFKLPNARYLQSVRLGRWDGSVSFCTAGGLTFLNLLPKLHPIIEKDGYEFSLEDNRTNYNFNFTPIDNNYLIDTIWGKGHTKEDQPIILEDHQVKTINVLLENKQGVVEAATGAGKTIISAALSKLTQSYGRSIVVVPSKDLVLQTEADYIHLGLDVGVFYGNRKEFNKTHTICTWQSLDRLNSNTKNGLTEIEISEFLDNVIMVLVDECHLVSGSSLQKLLSGPFKNTPLRFGLTGTVPLEPHLKTSIEAMLGDTLFNVSATELQEKGFLSNCHISIEQYKNNEKHLDWSDEARFIASDSTILENTASRIREISKNGNTFILVDRREAGERLSKLIPNSVFLNGDNKADERKEEYTEMNEGTDKIIIATFGIASTGINIPRIFNLVLYNPGKSFIRTIQSIGRGLRKANDKDFVQIHDICTTNKYSARHLTERKKFYKAAGYNFSLKKVDLV